MIQFCFNMSRGFVSCSVPVSDRRCDSDGLYLQLYFNGQTLATGLHLVVLVKNSDAL